MGISAHELMIGNYVKATYTIEKDCSDSGEWFDETVEVDCIVLGIDSTGMFDWPIVLGNINKDENFDVTEYEKVTGIPLNEEWLFKLGFVRTAGGGFVKKYSRYRDSENSFLALQFDPEMNRWVAICGNDNTETVVGLNTYLFIHEIQNLYFALTGEQLTIKN